MSAAAQLLGGVNERTMQGMRPFARPDGPVACFVAAHPRYDAQATDFLDPLELGDVYVFSDGSSLHYDYSKKCWHTKRGTIHSFGGARTLRRAKGSWQYVSTP